MMMTGERAAWAAIKHTLNVASLARSAGLMLAKMVHGCENRTDARKT